MISKSQILLNSHLTRIDQVRTMMEKNKREKVDMHVQVRGPLSTWALINDLETQDLLPTRSHNGHACSSS